MMQGCGNEIFSIFNRFRRLKISSILPGVSSVEMGTLKTIEHCRKEKEMDTKAADAKESETKAADAKVTVSEVVRYMRVAAPAVSRTLRSLEEKNYVERMVCEGDRRNVYVRVTEEGKEILNECNRILSELLKSVTEKMGEEDMNRLIGYLNKLEQTAELEIEKRRQVNQQLK